ncbi:uncharacterized protein LOC111594041 [Drosophila hydei]|uniref:carboxylesterase n=1 Tax=Drosophila hydei TaxID=7224 RepID=A0A6J2SYV3_DROHY|nr:uncharacterized protein LOC111594041 [Drosophila hydei]
MPDSRQQQFEAFMGIPFAKPPIGELRFQNPVAASAWTDVLDATAPRSHCLQKCFFLTGWPISGEEDCLYLNVYRPQHTTSPLPVMVYFHSGGYFCGSACPLAIGPEFFMDTQQVIVVTVSYRLGPFGFLSTGDAQMTGNFGLKDQRLALQWVQRHIATFGGDPNLVTILGHSAGGISSHLHMLSSSSNGLFHRAMSLSGTAMMAAIMVDNPLEQAQQLAEAVGVAGAKTLDSQALAAALRASDATDLLEAGKVFKQWHSIPIINYGVVVEKSDAPEPFITEHPVVAHQGGRINQVPWLLSSTSRTGEGAFFLISTYSNPQLLKEFNANFLEHFGLMLSLPKGFTKETVQDILEMYGVKEMQLNENTLVDLCGILGDFMFNYPVYVSAASYAEYAQQPVSIYSFEYTSNITYTAVFAGGVVYEGLGASHMDDGIHTMRMSLLFPDFAKDSENDLVAKRMTSLLVEFAKNGIFPEDTHLQPCKSEDFKADEICNYFRMEKLNGAYHETVEKRVDTRALAIWKKLYLFEMAKTISCAALYLILLSTTGLRVDADLDVCLEELGCLHGALMPDSRQQQFEAFMGIPFAKPPIGELRFQNPVAASAWAGVLDASAPRSHCLQKCYFVPGWPISGEEDCLYLNVYRPQGNASPLPVMVYFHSGGYFCGSACPLASGPEFLMDTQQVLLVTVSYRLGPFGFLSTGDAQMTGNFGLKDQRLALLWVQRNIAAFGGDPNLVTIFGHSAGGISTHLHMLSPSSNGLFHRAMSLSGTALLATTMVDNPLEQAQQLAEAVGVAGAKTLDSQALAAALRASDANELLEAGNSFKRWDSVPIINYAVVVEQPDAPEPFMTEYPIAAHQGGRIHQVPWLLSSTSRTGEGALFLMHIYSNPQLLKELNENFLELFGLMLYLPKGFTKETVQDILEMYGVKEMQLNENTLVDLCGILGDFMFTYPIYVSAASYAEYAQQPVSIYSFEYTSNITYNALATGGVVYEELGASHMDDAVHTIRMPIFFPDFARDSENAMVVKRLTSLLVGFAKNG